MEEFGRERPFVRNHVGGRVSELVPGHILGSDKAHYGKTQLKKKKIKATEIRVRVSGRLNG